MIRALVVTALILVFALLALAAMPATAQTVGAKADREMGRPFVREATICLPAMECVPVTVACRYIEPRLLLCEAEVRIK